MTTDSNLFRRPLAPQAGLASALWRHVEAHHADFGVALFVIPVLAIAFVLVQSVCAVCWLVG